MSAANPSLPLNLHPEQLLRYMPRVQAQRQELRLVEAAWDTLALLSTLSSLSSKASASNDLGRARQDFAALSAEMMEGLATEALNNLLDDLGAQAQMCIDILVRNLFERSADVGFFATDSVVAQYLASSDINQRSAIEAHLRSYASKYTVYINILLLSPDGTCVARLQDHDAVAADACADKAWMAPILQHPQQYSQDYAIHPIGKSSGPTLVYAQAVLRNDAVAGILYLEFDLNNEARDLFAAVLQGSSAALGGAPSVLAMVDINGNVVLSSDTLQLPAGWHLPAAKAAGIYSLHHLGRRYAMVVRETTGFQGYTGLGWRGVALMPLDVAFDESGDAQASTSAHETNSHSSRLPDSLRQIPVRSAAIQSALERSVWNGLLELNQAASDGSDAQARDTVFAKTLLSEIGVTAQKTAQAFSMALHDLHQVATASLLRDSQSRTALAMQILDRNLYERANDCRWWALTSQFTRTLQEGSTHCPLAQDVLQGINALYTVYTCLVLFDQQGQVIAVSDSRYNDQIGQIINEPWVRATLRLASPQDYVVSDLSMSPFCPDAPTYVYAAAVRESQSAHGKPLGGIAAVWDAPAQMQSILDDCGSGMAPEDSLLFVNAQDELVRGNGPMSQPGADLAPVLQVSEPIVDIQGQLFARGVADGPGYREYGQASGYRHGLRCVALRHLGAKQASATPSTRSHFLQHARSSPVSASVQLATFNQGNYWLCVDSALVHMAAPDAKVLAAPTMRAPFTGIVHIHNKVYPVLDMQTVIADSGATPVPESAGRQLIVLQIPAENGTTVEFVVRVDRLGAMLDLDPQQLHPIHLSQKSAPSMVAAVVQLDTQPQHPQGILCQLSKAWLQYCISSMRGDLTAQDLSQLPALSPGHQ